MGITTPLGILSHIILATESAVAFLGNGFIVVVNGHRWLQNRKVEPCDCLLTSLSISRIMLQLTVMINNILYYNLPEKNMYRFTLDIGSFFWLYFSHVSLWCATWLNVFLCVKVANFSHPLFLWLKLRINALAPRLLGLVIIAFLLFSVHPTVVYLENQKLCNFSGTLTKNATLSKVCNDPFFVFRTLQLCSLCTSFNLSITASLVLLISLWRHIRNLRKSSSVIKDLNTQVYLSVIKSLLFSLLVDITYFAALIIPMANFFSYGTTTRFVFEIVLSAVPSAHSMILISSNPKMKNILVNILHLRRRTT